MRERPIEDLLDALRQLGADAVSESGTGCPPVVVRADNPVTAGQVARSGGGITYGDAESFGDALDRAIAARESLGAAGRAWVERESSWEAFDARLMQLVALTAS